MREFVGAEKELALLLKYIFTLSLLSQKNDKKRLGCVYGFGITLHPDSRPQAKQVMCVQRGLYA